MVEVKQNSDKNYKEPKITSLFLNICRKFNENLLIKITKKNKKNKLCMLINIVP